MRTTRTLCGDRVSLYSLKSMYNAKVVLPGSDVNIHQTKLIPAYAAPEDSVGSPSSTTNMMLCSPGQEPIWQYFKNVDGK